MALLVQKFGGTSVGSVERIQNVASRILDAQEEGHRVVAVVSAMAGETARLIQLASSIHPVPYSREYDLLLSSGEQVSAGLLSLAINTEAERRGLVSKGRFRARPLLAYQVGIHTDRVYAKARIRAIETDRIEAELQKNTIPVIAGFQGIDPEQNITTLGRGGTDTSAVAIAAALNADECEILTDVDGVYTTDPRLYPGARKIDRISYEEMMELASLGAKVLQIRSVEIAAKYRVPLHVRSSFNLKEGTRVMSGESLEKGQIEEVLVSGVAADLAQVKLTVRNIPRETSSVSRIFAALSEASVSVDVIVQDLSGDGHFNVSFTVGQSDFLRSKETLLELRKQEMSGIELTAEEDLAKVSIVGVGMQHHPGVASKMFRLLAEAEIEMKLISTSEIKISCLIPAFDAKKAVATLHQGFGLDRE